MNILCGYLRTILWCFQEDKHTCPLCRARFVINWRACLWWNGQTCLQFSTTSFASPINIRCIWIHCLTFGRILDLSCMFFVASHPSSLPRLLPSRSPLSPAELQKSSAPASKRAKLQRCEVPNFLPWMQRSTTKISLHACSEIWRFPSSFLTWSPSAAKDITFSPSLVSR